MHIIGIIPARLASTRFPGKPLSPILGMPMLGHVFFRSKMSTLLDEVYVATCDQEIAHYTKSLGGQAIMTADTHERASDRTADALLTIENMTGARPDIVVMIQGDEPMVVPAMIDQVVKPLIDDKTILVANLMSKMQSRAEHEDVNEVKVVVDQRQFALYFSREPIPSWKKGANSLPMYKQVCIIPFRRDFLVRFNALSPTPLEIAESIDMLRVLEHGERVKMIETKYSTYSVDTEEDRQRVEMLMKNDALFSQYQQQGSVRPR
jgi:3-deoxy-manno-octulosonate cytidylyltransferase (CMP-KDO synthetase)